MNEELINQFLAAQNKTNELLELIASGSKIVNKGQNAKKKIGEITITASGIKDEKSFTVPQEMEDIGFFCIETSEKDRLIKRCSIGLSIDSTQYFEPDTPAKTFYFPEYNEVRMLDLREFSADGNPIKSISKQITIRYSDDSTVSSPAFAPYKLFFYIQGKSKNQGK